MSFDIKVNEVMSKKILTIDPKKTVKEAAKKMAQKRTGSIIVIKNKNPLGIITERDITKRVVAEGRDPKILKTKEIMTKPIVYVRPDNTVGEVVEKMKKHKIRRFPVVENGKIVGIITNTDISRLSPEMFDILDLRFRLRQQKPSIFETPTSGACEKCGNYSEDLLLNENIWICGFCRDSL